MQTFPDIIAAFEKAAEKNPACALDKQLGVSAGKVAVWKHRKRIPSKHWVRLVDAAKVAGIKGVNAASLLKIAEQKSPEPDAAQGAAA